MSRRAKKRRQGKREPNGRLSRRKVEVVNRQEMTEQEARSVAIAARMRRTGLGEELVAINEAGRPNAGTVHGVLALTGAITLDQYEAGEWYLAKRDAYLKAILAKGTAIEPPSPSYKVDDTGGYLAWCKATRETWAAVLDIVQEASTASRSPIASALDVILCRQQEVHHLLGDLRIGLNAIHRAFLAGRRKAA